MMLALCVLFSLLLPLIMSGCAAQQLGLETELEKRIVKTLHCGKDIYARKDPLQLLLPSNYDQSELGNGMLSARSELTEILDSRDLDNNQYVNADLLQRRKEREGGTEPAYLGYSNKTHHDRKVIAPVSRKDRFDFTFYGCSQSDLMGYNDTFGELSYWHGHLLTPSNLCLQPANLAVRDSPIVAGDCSFSDDSSQLFIYWRLTKYRAFDPVTKHSTLHHYVTFLGEPAVQDNDDFDGTYSTRYNEQTMAVSIDYRLPQDKASVSHVAMFAFRDTYVAKRDEGISAF